MASVPCVSVGATDNDWLRVMCETVAKNTREHGNIPIQIPTAWREVLGSPETMAVRPQETKHGYDIGIWDHCDEPDNEGLQACGFYQAGFSGQRLDAAGPEVTWHTRKVLLDSGVNARFRPVSCGGSCAPANLWWRTSVAEYSIQVKFGVEGERLQLRALLKLANSMQQCPAKL